MADAHYHSARIFNHLRHKNLLLLLENEGYLISSLLMYSQPFFAVHADAARVPLETE